MANVTTELKVAVKVAGERGLDQLKRSLVNIGKQSSLTDKSFSQLSKKLKEVQSRTTQSVNNLRSYSNAWKDIANSVEIGSKEFKEATAEAAKLDKQLQRTSQRRGGRLRAGAQIAGTVAGAGVFGGPEGAIGAAVGAIGGVPGAVVGGAIGAQLGQIRQALGATAEYSASLGKLRIALFGVTTSQKEYQESLAFIKQTTKDFAIPQEVVTRQFTKLQASVQGAGGNVEDTKTAFNGIVAAVRATGGSLADVDSALTATAQVFSKGKVSAEELRQQIGERLPGAFTLFADAIGLTPQELDKALEKGEVSLQDFQKFAEAIFKRYGENAKAIAGGPKSAGDRLKADLEELSESVGTLLEPIGAAFQEFFGGIVKDINKAIEALNIFLGLGAKGIERKISDIDKKLLDLPGTDVTPQAAGRAGVVDFTAARDRLLLQKAALQEELRRLQELNIEQPEAGTGLPGIDDSDEKKIVAGKEIVDITQEEFDLRKQIIDARKTDNKIAEIQLSADLKRFEILGAQIGEREKTIRLLEVEQNEAEALGKIYATTIEERIKLLEDQEAAEFRAGKAIADALNKADKNKIETFGESFKEVMQNAYKEATDLGTALGGVAVNAVDGLTDAIVEFATTGKAAFADFARSIISDLAKIFLKAAIFKTLDVAFPGLGLGAADGAAFDRGGQLTKYASGGVVNAPTFFRYQDGGQFKNGVMGEAGPEAILPLKRGSDGKLGVTLNESGMRESMSRYSRGARGGSVIPENGGGGSVMDGGGGTAVAAPIDVRYTVERINSVDYVTADQFQQGMQQAANQGAKQGEQQTLKRLQMSSSTRKRLGM